MKIDKLNLQNYRQYRGEQEVQFAEDNDENMTIIVGSNGAGKTNMFRSMLWCMYGDSSIEENQDSLPLLNSTTMEDMESGDEEKVAVEMVLGNPTPELSINREKTFRKEDGSVRPVKEEFYVMEKEDSGWVEKNKHESERLVFQLLPPRIRQFYFFDGEKLDSFFKPGTETRVEKTVKDVSQIDLLERAINHAERTQNKVSSDFKGDVSDELSEIADKIERKEVKIEDLEDEIDEITDEIEEKREKIRKIDDAFGQSSLEDVKALKEERSDLENRMDDLNEREEDVREDMRENILEHAAKIYALDALETAADQINQKDEEVGLPPDVQPAFVEGLLEAGRCICGESLDEENERNLRELVEEDTAGGVSTLAMEGHYEIQSIQDDARRFVDTAKQLMQRMDEIQGDQSTTNSRLQDISDILQNVGVDEETITVKGLREEQDEFTVEELEELRESLVNDKDDFIREQGHKEKELEETKKEKTQLSRERSKLTTKESKNEDLNRKMEALERGEALMKEVRDEIMDQVRSQIEERTEEQFFELIWKDAFDAVKINEEYRPEVLDRQGRNVLNHLSAGERQALALSFMAALKQVSGYEFPVFIDTPLGRISKEPRNNIAERFPQYLEGTQVTLLVTNTEYDEDFRNRIAPCVGRKYELVFDEETESTEVVTID